jgi:hypothetical protein
MKTGSIFAVHFYSASGVLSVKWYNSSEVIHNSNKWRQVSGKSFFGYPQSQKAWTSKYIVVLNA